MTLFCPQCGKDRPVITEKQFFKNNSIHIRASCSSCESFIKWLEKTPENEAMVNSNAAKKQLELFG